MNSNKNPALLERKTMWNLGINILILIPLSIWLGSGFYTILPNEQGLIIRFGQLTHNINQPGLYYHLPFPIEKVIKLKSNTINQLDINLNIDNIIQKNTEPFLVTNSPDNILEYLTFYKQTNNYNQTCLSVDNNELNNCNPVDTKENPVIAEDNKILDIQLSITWSIENLAQYYFNSNNTQNLLQAIANSTISNIIGQASMDSILSENNEEIELLFQKKMQKLIDQYQIGIKIHHIKIKSILPSQEVVKDFKNLQLAKDEFSHLQQEAEQYAFKTKTEAQTKAKDIILKAEAYYYTKIKESKASAAKFEKILQEYRLAPKLTKNHLYTDTIKRVFQDTNQ